MPSSRDIQRRIRSIKNIAQITKAMEVVSMNKMRHSQQFALAARPYALASLDMLKRMLTMTPEHFLPTLLSPRPQKHAALVVVTADKGLVGGFNDTVIREAEVWIQEQESKHIPYLLIVVGKKAREHFERTHRAMTHVFTEFGDYTEFKDTEPVAHVVLKGFLDGTCDSVDVVYTHFMSTLKQKTKLRTILPASQSALQDIIQEIIPESGLYSDLRNHDQEQVNYSYEYSFEPSPQKVVNYLVSNILKVAFHYMLLESNASEHSARMVTMKNASDNANQIQSRLTLEMNKVRQASITAEISEIIAGSEVIQ